MKLQRHHQVLVVGGWWCIAAVDMGMWALSCMTLYTPRVTMFMFEYSICMFEHAMCMFEHVMRVFEHVVRMFEHVMRTGAISSLICARHGAAGRPGRPKVHKSGNDWPFVSRLRGMKDIDAPR